MNRAVLEGIQGDYPRATRLKRPRIDLVRPLVVTLILVSALVLALLILLLSSGRRERRARRGRLVASRRGVVSDALFRKATLQKKLLCAVRDLDSV